jgi:fructoselysine and glucoselysine-specific PTS system IID component
MSSDQITKSDLRRIFWRSLSAEASFNYERMTSLGFFSAMRPALQKLYANDPVALERAMQRHLEFFNTTSAMTPFINGVATAMEEVNSRRDDFDEKSINGMKVGLMGPLAGIGDAFFWGTLRVIAAGIGASLSLQGNVLGPILFLVIYNVPNVLVRYFGVMAGYRWQSAFLDRIGGSGLMEKVTLAISILGITVVGGLTATLVSVPVAGTIGGGENAQTVQETLDSIMPALLPLALTFGIWWLLRRRVHVLVLVVSIIALGILGTLVGIFAI